MMRFRIISFKFGTVVTSSSMEAKQTLLSFARSQNIHDFHEEPTVKDMIVSNYHLLTSSIMKQMVATAIEERDSRVAAGGLENDLLGSWGRILNVCDCI